MWIGILIFYLIGCLINLVATIYDHYKYGVDICWLLILDILIITFGSWLTWIILYYRDRM